MPKPREEYIHILVRTRAWLDPLHMMGPIVHPLKVNKKVAIQLLLASCEVVEYVPKTKNTIILTLQNINSNDRYTEADLASFKEVGTPVKPVQAEGIPINDTSNEPDPENLSPIGHEWKDFEKEIFSEEEIKASQERTKRISEELGLNASPEDKITKDEADKIMAEEHINEQNEQNEGSANESDKAPADPEISNEGSKEQVVETEEKSEETQTEPKNDPKTPTDDVIANYPLTVKDGKVDETGIDWSQFTKAQRRALRARINELNANQ